MIQNNYLKSLTFFLSLMFTFNLKGQEMDTLKSNVETRWTRISFGINVGYFLNKSHSTGLIQGDFSTNTTPMIGLALRLNFGKKLSVGAAFNRYNLDLESNKPIIITTEAPSTIANEPNYLLDFKGSIRGFYLVFDIPFEVAYKFNTIKKRYIPIISVGTTFFIYPSFYLVGSSSDYIPYSVRASGSQPAEAEILRPNSRVLFSNKNQTCPFVTLGIIRALSDHSFVKLQVKYALNQNSATSILSSKAESITYSSKLYTQQLGLVAEYFVTFEVYLEKYTPSV